MVNWATPANGASLSLNAAVAVNAGTLSMINDGDDTTSCQLRNTGGGWALRVDLGQVRTVRSFRSLISRTDGPTSVSYVPEPASPPGPATSYNDAQQIAYAGESGYVALWYPVSARYWQFVWSGQATNTLTNVYAMELRDDVGSPWGVAATPSGAATTDVANQLEGYLGTSDNTHHDALPWTTKAELDTVSGNVGTSASSGGSSLFGKLNDLASGLASGGLGYFASLNTLIGQIKSVTDTLPTPIARLSSVVLDHYTADIAAIVAQINSVLANTAGAPAAAHFSQDVLAGRSGFPSGTPNTTWTMVDQTDFDTALAWDVPADLYIFNVTTVPPGVSTQDWAGLTFHPRMGSWCVLRNSIGGTRRFLEFETQALEDGGRRMAGLALKCKAGTIGTVQAWTLA